MRRMEKITGRSDDMIILRGVNVFPTQIEEQLMRVTELAPHFQIELTRDDRLDVMTIHTESTQDSSNDNARSEAGKRLSGLIKDAIGISAIVKVNKPGSVARSQGKAVRTVDNRPKN